MASRNARWAAAWATVALGALAAAEVGGCLQASGLGDITFTQADGGGGAGAGGGTASGGNKCTNASQCDDNDPCTKDTCTAGRCEHAQAPDGTACVVGGQPGQCKGGACENSGCTDTSQCPSMGPCQTASCNGSTGQCEYIDVPDGTPTPGVMQVAGDCKLHICMGGQDVDTEDNSDVPPVPAAMAGCADAKCMAGTPIFPLHATDSPCSTYMGSMPGFCSAAGACSACTQDSECAGTGQSNDCEHPACMNNACGQAHTAANTPTTTNPPQTAGDCEQIVCDGNGGTMMVADGTDVPNDPTGCNPGTCTAGVPGHTQAANGTPCGNGLACSSGTCAGCTMDSQCQTGGKTNGKCNAASCTCAPSTCAGLGLTCGSGPDGCGGTLSCNDNKKDGTETGVDCGGSTTACATRCTQGQACTATSDCMSGLTCADGVCCNSACTGACQACSAAKKGQGSDGICGAVVAGGTDPHGTCTAQAMSTCGETGTCNGSGACSIWPNGTQCAAASCAGNTLTKAKTCISGNCATPQPATQNCSPYMCVNNACTASCVTDTDCAAGDYCNASHVCVAKQGNGGACTATDQCTSGFCVSGLCCNSACTGQCQACSISPLTGIPDGICGSVKGGTPDPSGTCVDQGAASCGTDGNCTFSGQCEMYPAGTMGCMGSTTCSNGMLTTENQCDGNGGCTQGSGSMPCPNGFACQSGTACYASCTTRNQCKNGLFCTNGTACTAMNSGSTCTGKTDCSSDACLGGYCCTSNCNQGGNCGANACAAGTGACEYPAGNVCLQGICQGGNKAQNFSYCNGAGQCTQVGGFNCTTVCTPTGCNPCNIDADCPFGYCLAGMCVGQQASGAMCTANDQCLSGICNAGLNTCK